MCKKKVPWVVMHSCHYAPHICYVTWHEQNKKHISIRPIAASIWFLLANINHQPVEEINVPSGWGAHREDFCASCLCQPETWPAHVSFVLILPTALHFTHHQHSHPSPHLLVTWWFCSDHELSCPYWSGVYLEHRTPHVGTRYAQ